jgi:hypothetical protein
MVKTFDPNSIGIQDSSTKPSVFIEDDKLTVKTISVDNVSGDITIKGDVKIYGILDAGYVRTTEIIANQKYEKQYLEFASPDGSPVGTGLIWAGGAYNKQLVLNENPDRIFTTENMDLAKDRSYLIDTQPVLSGNTLGNGVVNSNLQNLGTLQSLSVAGSINIADVVHFNPVSERFSIGTSDANGVLTVYDNINDVELIITGNGNNGVIGTFNTKGLEVVTDNQTRLSVAPGGDITLGVEGRDTNTTRMYGKVGVGVKSPREQFEVAGNIRWANKLFAVGNQTPTDGNYIQGDIIWNSNPKSQAYVGWICTASGSPGIWKPFGMIAE